MAAHESTGAGAPFPRRALLRAGGAAALGLGLARSARAIERVVRADGPPTALVVLELVGGNDGLATVVPYGDDALHRARRTTARRAADLLVLDDYRGLHPGLVRLRTEYDAGRLAIVEGCGYPEAVRSHFRAIEVWHTAREAGRASGDGWIGRLSASAFAASGRPDAVVQMGGKASYALHSSTHPPVAMVSPTGYRWFGDEAVYAMAGEGLCEQALDAPHGRHAGRDRTLAALRATLDDATESSARVRRAAAAYRTDVEYPRSRLAASLRDVAALIEGGVGTRVYSINTGGFDTHANQRPRHDSLLGALDAALGAFFADLARSEAGRRTVLMVHSEFGRRLAENGSKGHDHGKAAPVFVWGHPVRGGLHGRHPSLTELDEGDLAFTTDFRSVYGTLVRRWFDADPAPVLGAEYPPLAFL